MEYTQGEELVIGACLIAKMPEMEMEWTLTMYADDPQIKNILLPNGDAWKQYIQFFFHLGAKELVFDCQDMLFSCSCDDKEQLIQLAQKIKNCIVRKQS
jgi:hypothetical protein